MTSLCRIDVCNSRCSTKILVRSENGADGVRRAVPGSDGAAGARYAESTSGAPAMASVRSSGTSGTASRSIEAMDLVDVALEIPIIGWGASLTVACAGSLELYRLARFH